jgi:hypothetical protein
MNYWIKKHESKNLRLWHIDDGERWWYSAISKEDAFEMHTAEMLEADIDESEISIHEVAPDTMVMVTNENGVGIRKPASEWASEGKGLVASTLF